MKEQIKPELKSRITTEEQLMSLKPNDKIYVYDSGRHDITFWKCLARVPYRTMEIMAFYEGGNMIQLSKHQLNRFIFTDHDEAYIFLASELRRKAESVERINLKITNDEA